MKQLYKILPLLMLVLCLTACTAKSGGSSQNQSEGAVAKIPASIEALAQAKTQNQDTVAWLRVANTEIDNSVLQSANNDDYLRRNEKGENDIWGCYFADYFANLSSPDSLIQNTVIYGHTDKSENPTEKRFTQLFNYLDLDFLKANPNIYLTIEDKELTFQIFAVFFTDTGFYYIDPKPSDQGFETFMKAVNEKNEFIFEGETVSETDKLLTLSGCAYRYDKANTGDQRLVVMAKLVDENSAAPKTVTLNPSPKRP